MGLLPHHARIPQPPPGHTESGRDSGDGSTRGLFKGNKQCDNISRDTNHVLGCDESLDFVPGAGLINRITQLVRGAASGNAKDVQEGATWGAVDLATDALSIFTLGASKGAIAALRADMQGGSHAGNAALHASAGAGKAAGHGLSAAEIAARAGPLEHAPKPKWQKPAIPSAVKNNPFKAKLAIGAAGGVVNAQFHESPPQVGPQDRNVNESSSSQGEDGTTSTDEGKTDVTPYLLIGAILILISLSSS